MQFLPVEVDGEADLRSRGQDASRLLHAEHSFLTEHVNVVDVQPSVGNKMAQARQLNLKDVGRGFLRGLVSVKNSEVALHRRMG